MATICLFVILMNANAQSFNQIDTVLRNQLNSEFDKVQQNSLANRQEKPLLTSTVRNIFHDCGGANELNPNDPTRPSVCDGCIDFLGADHLGLLDRAILPAVSDGDGYNGLETIYQGCIPRGNDPSLCRNKKWADKLTRSDFWALAATFAIEKAFADNINPGLTLDPIPLWLGRIDCSTSGEFDVEPPVTKIFPEAHAGWEDTFDWFQTNLGFNEQEIVAIMGAHTLGFVNQQFSGYGSGPWVGGNLNSRLNGAFYKALINVATPNKVWAQRQATNGKFEWFEDANVAAKGFVMLNVDMALWKDIDDPQCALNQDTGATTCTYDQAPLNGIIDGPAKWVKLYAENEQTWLNDFVAVFKKLITMGYTDVNGNVDLTELV